MKNQSRNYPYLTEWVPGRRWWAEGWSAAWGGWSRVVSLRRQGETETYDERILGSGEFFQAILEEADHKLARQLRTRKKKGSPAKVINETCRHIKGDVVHSIQFSINQHGYPGEIKMRYFGVGPKQRWRH